VGIEWGQSLLPEKEVPPCSLREQKGTGRAGGEGREEIIEEGLDEEEAPPAHPGSKDELPCDLLKQLSGERLAYRGVKQGLYQ
jgi:hypothetical protein